ncbi:Transmembrane protein 147 [Takifugu flavidus]|uniref:BOS complex subunit TMEM147 n=1 Tax=Takifugu flavidus TaxID=433684 RepID=A0A5C6PMM3_9TELE|nr:Transmembrane protein 147 [Takifugu flavidus]
MVFEESGDSEDISAVGWSCQTLRGRHSLGGGQFQNDNLLVVKENKTWEEALNHCLQLNACEDYSSCDYTYNLLSLKEGSNLNYIRNRIYGATTTEVWTGLRFLGGSWWWVDGKTLDENWKLPSCPSERNHCGALSEYNAFWRCVQAGATYLFVQLCKEFMKATVDLADLLGLHLVMSRNPGKGEYKIMVAAMGWATAELVHYIAMAAVVWMFTRYDLPKSFRLPVTVLLALCVYKAFLMELFIHIFLLGSWTVLLVKAVLTGAIALCSLFLFVTLVHSN